LPDQRALQATPGDYRAEYGGAWRMKDGGVPRFVECVARIRDLMFTKP